MSDDLDNILDDALNDFEVEEETNTNVNNTSPTQESPLLNENENEDPDEAITKILEMMSENMEKLSNNPGGLLDDNPDAMFEEIFGEIDKKEGGLDNFMDGFLKNLLSKDILYGPFKELSASYPKFLSENKEKLSVEEFKSYSNQLSIINAIIKEYDGEENVDKIMKLLDDMEKCGNLPDDIIKNLSGGMPSLPGFSNPKDCTMS